MSCRVISFSIILLKLEQHQDPLFEHITKSTKFSIITFVASVKFANYVTVYPNTVNSFDKCINVVVVGSTITT